MTDWKISDKDANEGWYSIKLIRNGSYIFCSTDSKRYFIYKDGDYVKIVTKDGVTTLDNWKCYPTKQDFINGMEACENAQKERIKELERQKAELEKSSEKK